MLRRFLTSALLLALVLPATLAAQDAPKKQPKRAPDTPAQTPAKLAVALSVTGLSEEVSAKVEESLKGVLFTRFVCPKCGDVGEAAGSCPVCELEREEKSRPLLKSIALSAEKGTIAFELAPGDHVRLSRIEGALAKSSVKLDHSRLELPKNTTLVFHGGASPEDAASLAKAFQEGEVANAEAAFHATTKEIRVRTKKQPPTWSEAASFGSGLAKPLRLVDAILGRVPLPKSK